MAVLLSLLWDRSISWWKHEFGQWFKCGSRDWNQTNPHSRFNYQLIIYGGRVHQLHQCWIMSCIISHRAWKSCISWIQPIRSKRNTSAKCIISNNHTQFGEVYINFKFFSIVAISCGLYHSICVDRKGKVYSWGRGAEGQLGLGDVESQYESCKINLSVGIGFHNNLSRQVNMLWWFAYFNACWGW